MKKNTNIFYRVRGNVFEIYSKTKVSVKVLTRKMVSTEFIQLMFLIEENEWSDELFNALNESEIYLISKFVHRFGFDKKNKNYHIAMSKYMNKFINRLRIIENLIKIGNLNSGVVNEYFEIIDNMKEASLIEPNYGNYLKRSLENTYKKQLADAL